MIRSLDRHWVTGNSHNECVYAFSCYQYNEAEKTFHHFCRRHFQIHFLERKYLHNSIKLQWKLFLFESSLARWVSFFKLRNSKHRLISTLIQVKAWCRQPTGHYLNQCWPISMASLDQKEFVLNVWNIRTVCNNYLQPIGVVNYLNWIYSPGPLQCDPIQHNTAYAAFVTETEYT